MSASSAPIHQLGRRLCSLDGWVWNVPTQSLAQPLARLGIGHSFAARAARGPLRSERRSFLTTRQPPPAGPRRGGGGSSSSSNSGSGIGILERYHHHAGLRLNPSIIGSSSSGGGGGWHSPNQVRRSCTSGGLLLLGLSLPSSQQASSVMAACTASATDTAVLAGVGAGAAKPTGNIAVAYSLLQQQRPSFLWPVHGILASSLRRGRLTHQEGRGGQQRRNQSSKSTHDGQGLVDRDKEKTQQQQKQQHQEKTPDNTSSSSTDPSPTPPEESIASSLSNYLQSHLPKIPHRPTKEELLAAATGFRQRLRVRLKWFSIRSMRPWNADEWGAFVSWFMLGHLVWILVGTTTFFSLVILTINTVFAQETLAKWVGDYLTQSAGVTVVFESAIVPRWKNGVITFRNVFVSRRPGQVKSSVMKGSSSSAAAIAAARHTHEAEQLDQPSSAEEYDDGNYTQFDVTINSVDVTLSFFKWWNGKGLLKDVEVKGVRGIVDRTFVRWAEGPLDPFSFRHEHQPGDFEIERFKLEDLMVTVRQPNNFRPFSISIFSCELPQLRKQWLFYDFLSANHVSGSYDGSLFTIHPRQVQRSIMSMPNNATAATMAHDVVDNSHNNINNPVNDPALLESPMAWKKFSRLRIDGLKIDHLNRGDQGPFGWIYEGNVDIVADVMLPAEPSEGIAQAMYDFYDKMEEAVTSNRYIRILDGNYGSYSSGSNGSNAQIETDTVLANEPAVSAARGHLHWPQADDEYDDDEKSASPAAPSNVLPQYVVMDLRLHLNDVRAAVPFFPASNALGYVNAALIRPIVAYINAKRTYIPINCRIVKHLSDFDGSWTSYDCGLMDDSSAEVYAAFARDVEDQHSRVRRLKKVGFWTLSMVVHALLAGVAGDLI